VAARVMRQILIDHARTRRYAKRGGGVRPASLDQTGALTLEQGASVLVQSATPLTPERAADLITFCTPNSLVRGEGASPPRPLSRAA